MGHQKHNCKIQNYETSRWKSKTENLGYLGVGNVFLVPTHKAQSRKGTGGPGKGQASLWLVCVHVYSGGAVREKASGCGEGRGEEGRQAQAEARSWEPCSTHEDSGLHFDGNAKPLESFTSGTDTIWYSQQVLIPLESDCHGVSVGTFNFRKRQ